MESIPLSEYAKRYQMHIKTARRKYKNRTLDDVVSYEEKEAGIYTRLYVVLKSKEKSVSKVVDIANNIANDILALSHEISEKTNQLKEKLESWQVD